VNFVKICAGGFQYPGHMYQTGVGTGPQTPYPHPPQIYAPIPSQSTGTGVFIPPISQYTRNLQCNQSQGLGHSDLQDRGGTAGNNIQVTGIAQHSSPAPAYLQQGVGPPLGGGAHSLSNIMYWSNNTSRLNFHMYKQHKTSEDKGCGRRESMWCLLPAGMIDDVHFWV
jgi:hypothetical protein